MKLHGSAKTCPNSRRLIARRVLEQDWTLATAAEAAGVSVVTARKWVERFREGDQRLLDHSSRPKRIRRLSDSKVEAVGRLRRLRMTAAEIAESLGLALSTVSRWLKRIGLGKRSRLDPPEPVGCENSVVPRNRAFCGGIEFVRPTRFWAAHTDCPPIPRLTPRGDRLLKL